MTFKVLIAQFAHETNTFSARPTTLESFRQRVWAEGPALLEHFRDTNTEIAGFLDAAAAEGFEAVPVVAANAGPSGKVTREAVAAVTEKLLAGLEPAPDGVLLALHGAMVTEDDDDGEGRLLQELRARLGPEVPIAATLDLHANVTGAMAREADILISYRTYPHVDMRERGLQAGRLLAAAMRGEIRPVTAVARRALLEGCDDGRTGVEGPMIPLLAMARDFETEEGVLAVSINGGFAEADIWAAGPSVTVTGSRPDPRWQEIAELMMDEVWRRRDERSIDFLTAREAVAQARALAGGNGPVVIADYADNPGGGGYGDATDLLAAMLEAGLEQAAFGALFDPEAVALLRQAGEGAEVKLALGGKSDPGKGGGPLQVTGRVTTLSDGRFRYKGPMYTGSTGNLGPCACLRVAGIDILVASHNLQVYDTEIFRVGGIAPEEKAIVALKSMHHFRGAFGPIAKAILLCDTGALCSPDRSRLRYAKLRRPIYPLDPPETCLPE